jgi:hypothetical protein
MPHEVPSHVAEPFDGGAAQALLQVPQLLVSFGTHAPLHARNPELQPVAAHTPVLQA